MKTNRWWRGLRGEWYVVAQDIFGLLVFLGPRTFPGLPAWNSSVAQVAAIAGKIFAIAGMVLLICGIVALGKNITPLPKPKENTTLVEKGPYRFVRHPIYGGLFLLTIGYALIVHGWLTLLYSSFLFICFDLKSRKEEEFLLKQFPDYARYKLRVSKFIPFIY
ncbi:MAG: isoprenylcysteine carboxylmethyltransferase family protein [Ignavibacteriae bacterium]|nr:isoprenylcysteine carboxylmethyltransferase family protein [Ignavibacteriota bacterium]